MKSIRFTERLNFEKELKSTVWGREFQQVNYSLTKEIGTYAAIGLALVEFKFMTTSFTVSFIYPIKFRVEVQTVKVNEEYRGRKRK